MKKEKITDYILNILMVVLFLILGLIIIFDNEDVVNVDEEKENNSYVKHLCQNVFDVSEVDGLKFSVSPVVKNETDGYRVEVKVTNISKDIFKLSGFTLIVYDESNSKIDTLSSFGYSELNVNESRIFLIDCDEDSLKDGYVIEYVPSYVISE